MSSVECCECEKRACEDASEEEERDSFHTSLHRSFERESEYDAEEDDNATNGDEVHGFCVLQVTRPGTKVRHGDDVTVFVNDLSSDLG